ncbi:apolipoprotein D-like [Schistocerca cancellata]|uniref:apolipoprotein D-like n=1 Tax=Schistocerca cancellata TaxID=274614 RepID=UPI002117E2EB|nr:apolipoprotein D-like [Schistocerca cancellata]
MAAVTCLLALLSVAVAVSGHSYHLGGCPTVDPMPDFDVNRFVGKWYVIQKTSTGSTCLVNNYAVDTNHTGHYLLEQRSQHFILGMTSVDHVYRYTGDLTIPDKQTPGAMRVRFPLSIAGSASYTVFATDYENYAGVFTCQKLAFAHRQSASILSRSPTLDKMYVEKIRSKLSSFGVDPFDLSIIKQDDCPKVTDDSYNININPDTFSPGSIAGVVRTAGDKLGDGVEVVAEGAKKVYHKVRGDRDREEISIYQPDESEWLP